MDPGVADRHSIQYASCYTVYLLFKNRETQEWVFPSMTSNNHSTAEFIHTDFNDSLLKKKFGISFLRSFPCGTAIEPFADSELKSSVLYRQLNGRKVFFFDAFHDSGEVKIDEEIYEDFAWVPVPEFHKFLTPERYQRMRPLLGVF